MGGMTAGFCFMVAALGFAVLLADAGVRSWRFPGRVDDPGMLWPRRAPALSPVPLGPAAPPWLLERPRVGDGATSTPAAVIADWGWGVPARTAEGATAEWSPLAEVGAVTSDTWDEADILAGFDRIVHELNAEPDWLIAFRDESMRSPVRRAWALETTGGFSKRQHMELEALLSV